MVEMLGVLAIIGVLSVGGIAGYSKAMNKYKINKTTDQVSMLVANIRTLFSTQGNYKDLKNSQAKNFGVVPNDMYTSTSDEVITNAFNGAVTIISAPARQGDSLAGQEDAFIIQYRGLSEEACVTIATGDWGSGQASGLIAIAAGVDKSTSFTDGELDSIGTKVNTVYVDKNSAATFGNKSGIAAPGAANSTPMSVDEALDACGADGSSGANHTVAWKYY
jgi:type II secretory pathway pseudopilin PulG